jgi:hypothetical protein
MTDTNTTPMGEQFSSPDSQIQVATPTPSPTPAANASPTATNPIATHTGNPVTASGTSFMLFPGESLPRAVPLEKVSAATQAGGQITQTMMFPDNKARYVPLDKVHAAIAAGGLLQGTAPLPPVPTAMEESVSLTPSGLPYGSMQATPAESTDAGHAAAVAQRESKESALGQVGMGIAKAGGSTVENTIGKLIPGQAPTQEELAPTNPWQMGGKVLERMAEYYMGSKAVGAIGGLVGKAGEALSETDRFKALLPVMRLLEDNPRLAKVAYAGLTQGTTGGGLELAHGSTPTQAGTAAGINTVLGSATEGISQGLDLNTSWLKKGMDALVVKTAKTSPAASESIQAFRNLLDSNQPERLKDVNKDVVSGILSNGKDAPSFIGDVASSTVDLARKFSWKVAKTALSTLVTDLALKQVPESLGIDESLRHYIDASVGIGAFLHGSGKEGVAVLNSPEANELRGQIAAYVAKNPEIMQSIWAGFRSLQQQAVEQITPSLNHYVFNPSTRSIEQQPAQNTQIAQPQNPNAPIPSSFKEGALASPDTDLNAYARGIAKFEGVKPNSVSVRNNNPGNLVFANQPYAQPVKQGDYMYARFDTAEHGQEALMRQLAKDRNNPRYNQMSPEEYVNAKWSPANAPGNTLQSVINYGNAIKEELRAALGKH